jgi:hypothetical protein
MQVALKVLVSVHPQQGWGWRLQGMHRGRGTLAKVNPGPHEADAAVGSAQHAHGVALILLATAIPAGTVFMPGTACACSYSNASAVQGPVPIMHSTSPAPCVSSAFFASTPAPN